MLLVTMIPVTFDNFKLPGMIIYYPERITEQVLEGFQMDI